MFENCSCKNFVRFPQNHSLKQVIFSHSHAWLAATFAAVYEVAKNRKHLCNFDYLGTFHHFAMTAMEVVASASLDVSKRTDGRSASQLRPLECSRGLLTRAHGSATWSQGNCSQAKVVPGGGFRV
jgi:polyribonucleotide nucleotidyltransferase